MAREMKWLVVHCYIVVSNTEQFNIYECNIILFTSYFHVTKPTDPTKIKNFKYAHSAGLQHFSQVV